MEPEALARYYAARAGEYERVYLKPERQADLAALDARLRAVLAGRDVLEVACGTGYWTERYAPAAASVLATDVGEEVLRLARAKPYPPARVAFAVADALAPMAAPEVAAAAPFSGALAAFWWSHLPVARLGAFLDGLHAALAPGAVVALCDNRFVAGSSTPIAHADAEGNTYQERRLADGSRHVVRKNFPAEADLRAALAGRGENVEVCLLDYFWLLTYVVPG